MTSLALFYAYVVFIVRMRLIGYDRDLKPFTGKVDVQIMVRVRSTLFFI